MPRHTDVASEFIGRGAELPLNNLMPDGAVEQVAENMGMKDQIELEKFMNEILTIYVHPDPREGALHVINPIAGPGQNQPIMRGVNSKVKRKYVEVLARSRNTSYMQRKFDADDPRSLQMVPQPMVTYPFSVIHDPNPRGPEWLQSILMETE